MSGGVGLVLLYHRVGEALADPWELAVPHARFIEHMEVLKRDFAPAFLDVAVQGHRESGSVPAIAVTFDDGYAETAWSVLPVIERLEIPVTFFVPSGALDSPAEFWWDEVESIVLSPGDLPATLRLDVGEHTRTWELGDARRLTEAQLRDTRGWAGWQDPPGPRHALFLDLWRLCQRLPASRREAVVDQLRAWSGRSVAARPGYRPLGASELARLAACELVSIGGHTVTHPSLATLAGPDQSREVGADRDRLRHVTGQPVTSFAYPFGKSSDYTAETAQIVREAGFTLACANERGRLTAATDRFAVPRLFVPNWSPAELVRRVTDLVALAAEEVS